MRFGQPTQGVSGLGMLVFPAVATAEGRLCTETYDPCASFGEPYFNGMTAPPEKSFGQQGVSPTIFQRHLGFKGSPFRPAHLGGC
jgi:hypothetical protein